MTPGPALAAVLAFAFPGAPGAAGPAGLVQDFERPVEVTTWPEATSAGTSTAWAADGARSLRIPADSLAAVAALSATDWSGYDLLTLRVNVPGSHGCALVLELRDDAPGYHNAHIRPAAAPAGESTLEVEIGGELWRGEANRPYRELKTPLNKARITRLGIEARGATVYVDAIRLARSRPAAAPGGCAFDFGGERTPVGGGWTGVFPSTAWDAARGYGFEGTPRAFGKAVPYPTVVMGDGLMFGDAAFSVSLAGGRYAGWAVFERSGFWEGEQAAYAEARLLANGATVHAHRSAAGDAWFALQDEEITDEAGLIERLVMRRQGEASFTFDAAPGRNRFSFTATGVVGEPPRLAGMVLAPDTPAGRAFVAGYRREQRASAARAHRIIGGLAPARSAVPGDGLVVRTLPVDRMLSPADDPPPADAAPAALEGFPGTVRPLLLGVWTGRAGELTARAEAFTGPAGTVPASAAALWVNRYLPVRGFEMTACRIETHHYRPLGRATAGPRLPRALLLRVRVPADASPGAYAGAIELAYAPRGGAARTIRVPVRLTVLPGALPPLDIPFGLFFSAPPVPVAAAGEALWWKLAEGMLDLMADAGLTMLTGGPDYAVRWDHGRATYEGDGALRLLALARPRGLALAVSGYGGLSLGLGPHGIENLPAGMEPAAAARELARAWEAFRKAHDLPPHFVYTYDEPGTASEFAGVGERLALYKRAGFKTTGYTSLADPARADADHRMLARETAAPAYGEHAPATLRWVAAQGNEPWVYNNGLGRFETGVHLWRMRRAGARGRVEWIGAIVQGWQFDSLDAREPDPSCFFVHSGLGALFAPRYLSLAEGLYDARLLIALERRLAGAAPAAAAPIRALFAELEAKPYGEPLTGAELDAVRARVTALLGAGG